MELDVFTRISFKSFIIIASVLLSITASFAQDIALSPEAKKAFYRQKITVETTHQSVFRMVTSRVGISKTKHNWTAYKGYKRISKDDFFDLTGFIDEREIGNSSLGSFARFSSGLALIGASVAMSAFIGEHGSEYNPLYIPAAALAGGGILVISRGFKLNMRWVPASTASSMADDYNHQLMLNISKNF